MDRYSKMTKNGDDKCCLGIEGYFLYYSISRVFNFEKAYVLFYLVGFGIPLALVCFTFTLSKIFDLAVYIRFYMDTEDCSTVCWLRHDFMWIVLVPVGTVITFNILVTVRAVAAAYQSAGFRFVIINKFLQLCFHI